jgi:hypothetical protein
MSIQELNKRRCDLALSVEIMGMANRPTDYEKRLASDAAYHLAHDAWMRSEGEYQKALSALPTSDLVSLASGGG